jgi:hypothetical protein
MERLPRFLKYTKYNKIHEKVAGDYINLHNEEQTSQNTVTTIKSGEEVGRLCGTHGNDEQ